MQSRRDGPSELYFSLVNASHQDDCVCSEQAELQKRAIFEDSHLSFQATSSEPSDYPDIPGIFDYDDPTVCNEPPEAITISGLKYVGGLDISFVPQGHDNSPSASSAGHNASGKIPSPTPPETEPDAYAVITVLDYPALTVSYSINTSTI